MSATHRWFIGALLASAFSVLLPAELHAQRVAIVAADAPFNIADVRLKLISTGLTDVTDINVAELYSTSIPTLEALQQYDAVITWSNFDYRSPNALGDRLADYADGGGGVVVAAFSFQAEPLRRLGGRWLSGGYDVFPTGSIARGTILSIFKTLPGHPIMAGVNSFSGGSDSWRHVTSTQGCADLVATWSNGLPLVAARTGRRAGQVVGLNFFPVSSDLNASYWNKATDGALLMANALRFAATPAPPSPTGPAVALLAGDFPARAADLRCKLEDLNKFSSVDIIDVRGAAPDLATLAGYDAVLTWTSSSYGDPNALGDVLADYVDLGRGVVQSTFSFDAGSGPRIGGRWQSGGYRALTEADPATSSDPMTLTPIDASHPILSEVHSFNGGTRSYHASPVALDAATTLVAAWSNGQPLVAAGITPTGGRTIGLNMYPPSSDVVADSWDRHTDGARIMANALLLAAEEVNRVPSVDAGADQTIEATSAAGESATLTATASDPDDDPITLTWTGAVPPVTGQSITVTVGPPPFGQASQTYSFLVTAADGRGGEATDTVDIIVRDTQGPALRGMPSGILEVAATGPDGADATYGPVAATDAVDGDVSASVVCAPAPGLFAIGDTVVNCSASDSHGNTTSHSFTVRVTEVDPDPEPDLDPDPKTPGEPGKMIGNGFLRDDDLQYEFSFTAVERPSGVERGGLLLTVKSGFCDRHGHGRRRGDRFVSRSVDSVTFDEDSTVLFAGTGRWNGQEGYRYEVSAADKGVRRRNYDVVRITITSPTGEVVAHVDGKLRGGNIRFVRFQR